MGDTQAWARSDADVPKFDALFVDPEHRDDALEAVKSLKPGIDPLHVRKFLWEAQRQLNLALIWMKHRAKAEKLARALRTVNLGFDPSPVAELEREFLKSKPKTGKKGGRPVLPCYRKAVRDLASIGVRRDLALTMLRAVGFKYGPPPQS